MEHEKHWLNVNKKLIADPETKITTRWKNKKNGLNVICWNCWES